MLPVSLCSLAHCVTCSLLTPLSAAFIRHQNNGTALQDYEATKMQAEIDDFPLQLDYTKYLVVATKSYFTQYSNIFCFPSLIFLFWNTTSTSKGTPVSFVDSEKVYFLLDLFC